MTEDDRGQEMMETRRIPAIIAPLTLYIKRTAVKKPPQNIPIHIVWALIFSELGQAPSLAASTAEEHPASSKGVAEAPTIAPIPAL